MTTNKNGFAFGIMLWVTILTVWAVNSLTSTMSRDNTVHVNGIPHAPQDEPISVVRMNDNTVWVVNANTHYIRVIAQEEDGSFTITGSEMQFQER